MSEYFKARQKKKEAIRHAFWKLYKKYNYQNVMTVKEIIDEARIHRTTFYFYYQNIADILDELINWLKEEIVDIYSSRLRADGNFNEFYKEMYVFFKTRSEYLIPLVCEYRHPEFALWYRNNQREMFKEDIGLAGYRTDKYKNKIIDIALTALIEEQIQTFAYGILTIDDSFYIEYGTLNEGLYKTLENRFGIKRGS